MKASKRVGNNVKATLRMRFDGRVAKDNSLPAQCMWMFVATNMGGKQLSGVSTIFFLEESFTILQTFHLN